MANGMTHAIVPGCSRYRSGKENLWGKFSLHKHLGDSSDWREWLNLNQTLKWKLFKFAQFRTLMSSSWCSSVGAFAIANWAFCPFLQSICRRLPESWLRWWWAKRSRCDEYRHPWTCRPRKILHARCAVLGLRARAIPTPPMRFQSKTMASFETPVVSRLQLLHDSYPKARRPVSRLKTITTRATTNRMCTKPPARCNENPKSHMISRNATTVQSIFISRARRLVSIASLESPSGARAFSKSQRR